MRLALAIIIATLTLGPGHGPVLAQTRNDVPALETIRMVDALTGWAVTHDPGAGRLLRSTDGGTHWRDVTPPSSSGRQMTVYHVAVLTSLITWVGVYEGTLADTTRIFHTVDGGRTWGNGIPVRGGPFHFINAHDGWLLSGVGALGSMEVDIYRSTNGGETWTKVASTTAGNENSGLPFGGNKGDVTFLNPTTGWVTGTSNAHDWLYLYVTRDGGRTWRQQKLPLPPGVTSPWSNWTMPPRFFTARDGILPMSYGRYNPRSYAPIASVVVFYVTHDGGTTWTYTTPVSLTQCDCPWSFADVNHGWVKNGAALYKTSDSGRQWTTIQPIQPFGDVRQLSFVSPQIGWALSKVSPFLLKTLDGGRTWAPVTYTISRP